MKKVRADVLAYRQGLAKSREMAKRYIMAGSIYNGEEKVEKPGEFFDEDTVLIFKGERQKYVSRGGTKLEAAIEEYDIDFKDVVACDFGSSTGGFTDCMLQNGAKKVYAIDVGHNQLDYSLRVDDRVVVMEKTNIRHLDLSLIEDPIDFISIDVSFISLELILPKAFQLIEPNGSIVALIKPQFEAGKDEVGSGGIVRDADTRKNVIEKIDNFVRENQFYVNGIIESPITGAAGNVEYLALIEKTDKNYNIEDINKLF